MPKERLVFHPRLVNGRNVYQYIHSDEDAFLDQGVDSQVYHFDRWVIHQFFHIPLSKILALQAVTDEIVAYAPHYTTSIGLWGTISMRVTPIVKVFESHKYHQAFAIKEYVGGFRPKQKQNRMLDEFLLDFSADMCRRTGVRGIQIIAPNTKLQKINQGILFFARNTCTVTDPCQYLKDFTG